MVVAKRGYLVSTTVEIGHFFGAKPEDGYIELREPAGDGFLRLQAAARKGDEELKKVFLEELPALIGDHDLYKDEETKRTAEEVADLVKERHLLYIALIDRYGADVLFIRGKKKA